MKIPERVLFILRGKRLPALLVLFGAALLIIPTLHGNSAEVKADASEPAFSVETEEKRIAAILSEADGAGKVSVMLSVSGSIRRELASDEERSSDGDRSEVIRRTVTVSRGGSVQEAVTLCYVNPEYVGAVVIAEGAGSGSVRLALTEAVSALTGLGADRIKVIKMET